MKETGDHTCGHTEHVAHEIVTLEGILEGLKVERSQTRKDLYDSILHFTSRTNQAYKKMSKIKTQASLS